MVIWITGISGSGKTTIATKVYEKIKQQNLDKIFSPEYYPGLKDFLELQNSYINKCKWALEQMKKVNALLLYQLNIKS